jgi:RNA polymerase sigma-70 factor (ECF subfamily)
MANDLSFNNLFVGLRAGHQSAAAKVVADYTRRLIAVARNRLRRFRAREDPEDVLQSVFKSFFLRCEQGQYQLEGHEDLWRLLVRLTLNKCGHHIDYHGAACRDPDREVAAHSPGDSSSQEWEALAREPSPAEAAILIETVEQLLRDMKPHQREIVRLGLEGQGSAEIARHVRLAQKTVQRGLKEARDWLERRCDAGEP